MHPLHLIAALFVAVAPAGSDSVPLYDGLGDYHHAISTHVPLAQEYFDQGLRLTFAFNHHEAVASFLHAAALDDDCAMCWWGAALALGPNINAGMEQPAGLVAYRYVREALARRDHADERERAYIDALATRYAPGAPDDRAALDSAYARAMAGVAHRWPEDATAVTLYAEALMDLTPWLYWEGPGRPRRGTTEILSLLESVIARHPTHPGACHYYIHAVEQHHPERAVACAERLAAAMPGAGHIVHMPGHIYIRVGRYADAVTANHHAIHADERYIADRGSEGFYQVSYYPHNYHFLAFAAMMSGQREETLRAAAALGDKVPVAIAEQAMVLQDLFAYRHLAQITFGQWREALDAPLPPVSLRYATGLAWYARGIAFARTGEPAGLRAALDSVATIRAGIDADPFATTMLIAEEILRAQLAAAAGDDRRAVAHLRAAAAAEDGLGYMEPPFWHKPVRHMLGQTLLRTGALAEAERVYREDLARFPANGWSLRGLALALEGQGRMDEAASIRRALADAWQSADAQLTGSSF